MAQNPQLTNPLLNQFQYTYEKDSVTIYGQALIGSLGVVSSFSGLGISSISKTTAPATASFTGQVAGMTTNVTITANNPGAAGNITLTADSVTSISGLITAWNLANPTNQVTLTSGNGAQVPTANIVLSGGSDGSDGEYNVVLLDVFNKLMMQHGSTVKATASSVAKVQLLLSPASAQSNVRSSSSKLLLMQCYDYAGVAVNPTSGELLQFRIVLRNSSLNAPTG